MVLTTARDCKVMALFYNISFSFAKASIWNWIDFQQQAQSLYSCVGILRYITTKNGRSYLSLLLRISTLSMPIKIENFHATWYWQNQKNKKQKQLRNLIEYAQEITQ